MPTKVKHTLFFIFILLSVLLFHRRSLFYPPIAKHVWAQSDWYALALGFQNNNMDFLHPETFILNTGSSEQNQSITAVDFPIVPYTVAALMNASGNHSAIIYRLFTLFISLFGIFCLYLSVYGLSKQFHLAASITAFVYFQPTFVFYSDGFLPTQHALSIFLIALFFYSKYINNKRFGMLAIAVLFSTLSALIRLPFVIFPIALFTSTVLFSIQRKKLLLKEAILFLVPMLAVLGYYIYNTYLTQKFGSAFLNHSMHPRSVEELISSSLRFFQNNLRVAIPLSHLFVLIGVVSYAIKRKNLSIKDNIQKPWFILGGVYFFGVLTYAILMIRQLPNHDYYFNDFALPLITTLLVYLSSKKILETHPASKIVAAFFVVAAFQLAYSQQTFEYRQGFQDNYHNESVFNYENAEDLLVKNDIPPTSHVMIIGTFSPNASLYAVNRKGYYVRIPNKQNLKEALKAPPQFYLTQLQDMKKIRQFMPEWNTYFEKLDDNGKIALWRKLP